MRKVMIFVSFLIGFLLLIIPCVNSIEHQNQKTVNNSEIQKIDHPSFIKKMLDPPYWYFGIALGDFSINGNQVEGHARSIYELYMKYFIFPELSIRHDTNINPYITDDECFYYKLIYTNHIVIIIAIVLESPPHTPNIACTTDSTTNRITVATADANIKWRDILISTDNQAVSWRVYSADGVAIDAWNHTNGAGLAEVIAGDYIQLQFNVTTPPTNVRVTFRYIPMNSLLGTWTVNV